MKEFVQKRLGYRPALPDVRDRTLRNFMSTMIVSIPDSIDGKEFCSPIVDQGELGSCTGQAMAGFSERMLLKMFGRHTDLSALFNYCTGRYEMEGRFQSGDIGCTIRDVMKAAVKYGICPESDWKIDYDPSEIPVIAGLAAQTFKPKAYYRLDPPGVAKMNVEHNCLSLLAKGYSIIAGFSVYSSIGNGPDVPYPTENDNLWGGHAIHIVGYDKKRIIGDCHGAYQFPNTWGIDWGENGFGWLPMKYLRDGLLSDAWTMELFDAEDLGIFG
jgi:C1A family cysteine protease